jgi:hypothetical protein
MASTEIFSRDWLTNGRDFPLGALVLHKITAQEHDPFIQSILEADLETTIGFCRRQGLVVETTHDTHWNISSVSSVQGWQKPLRRFVPMRMPASFSACEPDPGSTACITSSSPSQLVQPLCFTFLRRL